MIGTTLKFGLLVFAFWFMPQAHARKPVVPCHLPTSSLLEGPYLISPDDIPDEIVETIRKKDSAFDLKQVICATNEIVSGSKYAVEYLNELMRIRIVKVLLPGHGVPIIIDEASKRTSGNNRK